MPSQNRRILTHVTIIIIAFAAGWCAGLLMYPDLFSASLPVADHDHAAELDVDHEDEHEDEDVISLTPQAVANLGLKLQPVAIDDYWKVQTYPAEVVEIDGQSELSVSAPVTGIIERVDVRVGQSVDAATSLFQIRITDQLLTTAQSALLDMLSQREIAMAEIERLAPLASQGAVSGTRKRDLEYDVRGLDSRIETKEQEILARGLPRPLLDRVIANRELANRIDIKMPVFDAANDGPDVSRDGEIVAGYTIGAIQCHPGMTVQTGDVLCQITAHGMLFLKGQAFETDLNYIAGLSDSPWQVTAQFGHQHHDDHQHAIIRGGLKVTRIDNHVDSRTQTFSFYMPLKNEVTREVGNEGRLYRQWRFRPGQRAHLKVPVEKQSGKIKLPVSAVATEGPNSIVFRLHQHGHDDHDHDDHDDHDHDDHDHDHDDLDHDHDDHDHAEHELVELKPVPVHVLLRDSEFVVVDPDGELRAGDHIAINAAHRLHLAWKMNTDRGGGHDHDH